MSNQTYEISTDRIRTMRSEAVVAGDQRGVETCDAALGGDESSLAVVRAWARDADAQRDE
jgi:hypothetical protein